MVEGERLDGWKAIAGHLKRDERTAMRWANERGMPVRRTPGPGRGSVYTFRSDLDAWLRSAEPTVLVTGTTPPEISGSEKQMRPKIKLWLWVLLGSALIITTIGVGVALIRRPDTASAPSTADARAKELYLQASFDWNLRTRDSLTRAISEYSQAIGRDPGMAPAYVGLANSYLLLREYGALPDAVAYGRAEAAAKAALALDPRAADAHRALAFLAFWWHGDPPNAGMEFRRTIALAPRDPLSHHWYANALSANGEPEAALQEILIARDLDPTSISILSDIGLLDYLAGHRAEGLALLHRLERDQPNDLGIHRALADFALFDGRSDEFLNEAIDTLQRRGQGQAARDMEHLRPLSRQGARAVAGALIRQAKTSAPHEPDGYFELARLYSVAGNTADALNALKTSCAHREVASVGAPGSLWLSRSLTKAQIASACGRGALL